MDLIEETGGRESFVFDSTECRIVGTLVEKALATPETYPLTVNALLAGCNQKSNRDPQMALEAFEIEGALMALQIKGAVNVVERFGGRTVRYGHRVAEQLGLETPDLAILAELLVRGPQTVNELVTRARRMGATFTAEQLEARLRGGADGPAALYALNSRRPGERYPRWRHLLSAEASAPITATDDAAAVAAAGVTPTPAAATSAAAVARPAATGGGSDLAARVAALEARVACLEQAIGAVPPAPADQSITAAADGVAEPPESQAESEAADWIDLD